MVGGTTVTYTTGAGEFLISKARLIPNLWTHPTLYIEMWQSISIILIYSTCITARDHGLLAVRDTYDTGNLALLPHGISPNPP